MVKKSSKVTAHFWIGRPLFYQWWKNLCKQGDFLYEGWSFLPFMSHNLFICTTNLRFTRGFHIIFQRKICVGFCLPPRFVNDPVNKNNDFMFLLYLYQNTLYDRMAFFGFSETTWPGSVLTFVFHIQRPDRAHVRRCQRSTFVVDRTG